MKEFLELLLPDSSGRPFGQLAKCFVIGTVNCHFEIVTHAHTRSTHTEQTSATGGFYFGIYLGIYESEFKHLTSSGNGTGSLCLVTIAE